MNKVFTYSIRKLCSSKNTGAQVSVIGASGGIGQPLSLLLKQSPLVKRLNLFDLVNVPGVAADLSHIETPANVFSYESKNKLDECMIDSDVVVVCAGIPRKPGMTRDDLFKTNASIIKGIAESVAKNAPKAMFCIITNPVNSTVPIAVETFKKAGICDVNRIFGVTLLDTVRANTFAAELKNLNALNIEVPVIGGHSGHTIIPLYSQATPKLGLNPEEIVCLSKRVQNAGTLVVEAKAGLGSATLSTAYAAARFVISIIRAIRGEKNIIECAYVQSDVHSETDYFANPILLGKNGIEKNLGMGKLSKFEQELLEIAIPELKKNIKKGEEFVNEESC